MDFRKNLKRTLIGAVVIAVIRVTHMQHVRTDTQHDVDFDIDCIDALAADRRAVDRRRRCQPPGEIDVGRYGVTRTGPRAAGSARIAPPVARGVEQCDCLGDGDQAYDRSRGA